LLRQVTGGLRFLNTRDQKKEKKKKEGVGGGLTILP